jgi:hypothetical protein
MNPILALGLGTPILFLPALFAVFAAMAVIALRTPNYKKQAHEAAVDQEWHESMSNPRAREFDNLD